MRREASRLGALADTDVPHPRLIAAEGDIDVLGAAFYLMEPIDGFQATSGLPAFHAGSGGTSFDGLLVRRCPAVVACGRSVDEESRRLREARGLPQASGAPLAVAARELQRDGGLSRPRSAVPRRDPSVPRGEPARAVTYGHHPRRLPPRQRDVPPGCR